MCPQCGVSALLQPPQPVIVWIYQLHGSLEGNYGSTGVEVLAHDYSVGG